jgi:hypothetical protein
MPRNLTLKQELFISAYLGEAHGNATEAARIAGYKKPHPEGFHLLRNPTIAARVKAKVDTAAMKATEVLGLLTEHATGSMEYFIDLVKGQPVLNLVKAEQAGKLHLLKRFGYNKFGQLEIELYDAQAAVVHLGKHHKLFTDRTEVDVTSGGHALPALAAMTDDELRKRTEELEARELAEAVPEES